MKILYCSDGSSQAEKSVRFVAQIAAACRAQPSILGITEKAAGEVALLQALGRAQDIFKEHQLDAEVVAKVGDPAHEIVKRTSETQYDLVVLGAVCKNPFLRLLDSWRISGQTRQAYRIIESVEPPVLVVFCSRPALRRILLCTRGGPHIDKAIEFAGKLAQCASGVVNLFHVMQEPPALYADLIRLEEDADRILESNSKLGRVLRHQKELLERLGVFGEIRLRHGLLVPELLKELQRGDYDLVVSGSSPAEQKLYKYVMGDVTREIVNRAQLPILVVRTGPKKITHLFKELLPKLMGHFRKTSQPPESFRSNLRSGEFLSAPAVSINQARRFARRRDNSNPPARG